MFSPDVHCFFCPECGCRIYHQPTYSDAVRNVKPGTLDDPSALQPKLHAWTASRQGWVPIPPDAKTSEKSPF